MYDPEAQLLRRYVLERAAGRTPAAEYVRLEEVAPGVGGWIRCDEKTARESEHWRRLRRPGALWCPVLGNRLGIAQDVALQAYFLTVPEGGWQRLADEVRRRPSQCLRHWRDAGRRILAASAGTTTGRPPPQGRLAGWPAHRGTGSRSLQYNHRHT
jgi:hypothetical protein